MVSLAAMLALANIGQNQPRGTLDDLLWRFRRGHVDYMGLSASKTPDRAIRESLLMRHKVIEYNRATSAYGAPFDHVRSAVAIGR
jgi:hypothetical protein